MADPARARKLAKRIKQIVASALEHEVKDPRLTLVTITDVKLTGDLQDATVFYTVFGDSLNAPPDTTGAALALESAKGVLRSLVGQGTGVRFTPTLTFQADTIPEDARRLDDLLAKVKEADEEVARIANGAKPAGEADPYRPPRESDPED
nr:30S ribosome-binding factor RbfA [Kibdelosporangium sp. MJ126-NF4]CEL16773.1 Ribosome-binding factor A [Kibdelosporangium sp. MJ126-NF4]CTQ91998.1 Ribosome-binding factor A [Kibdelosporangium sp. MJ126-NF4]